jgi:hypothetical protein
MTAIVAWVALGLALACCLTLAAAAVVLRRIASEPALGITTLAGLLTPGPQHDLSMLTAPED